MVMTSFAPKNVFGGDQIGVPRYLDTYIDLEFLCITRLELRSVGRNQNFPPMFVSHYP